MLKKRFENAYQFLACYFHQDFGFEFGEPEAAIEKFVAESSENLRGLVLLELREIQAEFSQEELSDVLLKLGCYYRPQKHRGITMKVWVSQVIAQIERGQM